VTYLSKLFLSLGDRIPRREFWLQQRAIAGGIELLTI
jgi:hypothetical protein